MICWIHATLRRGYFCGGRSQTGEAGCRSGRFDFALRRLSVNQFPRMAATLWLLSLAFFVPSAEADEFLQGSRLTREILVMLGDGQVYALEAATGPEGSSELTARRMSDGELLWTQPLESLPVHAGVAIDREQRIFMTLENGKLLCFRPGDE